MSLCVFISTQNVGRTIRLIPKSVKCRNKKIFVTEIFKVKIGLSAELMNDISNLLKNRPPCE